MVLFDSDKEFGNYWCQSYRAPVDLEGSFVLKVDEPFAAASGNLSLFFCTEDRRNTGRETRRCSLGTSSVSPIAESREAEYSREIKSPAKKSDGPLTVAFKTILIRD